MATERGPRSGRPLLHLLNERWFCDSVLTKIQYGDGCWEWDGSKNHPHEYAMVRVPGKRPNRPSPRRVIRVMWTWLNQEDIPVGYLIRHTCDNAGCVRPSHLLIGTPHDNNMDYALRGRFQNTH